MLVLKSMLQFGLLCTPEHLKIYPSRHTSNKAKLALITKNKPEHYQVQSRFCLTLSTEKELFEKKVQGLKPGPDGPIPAKNQLTSHADLFGSFAISFDPLQARQIGIVPTMYFSPSDMFGERFEHGADQIPGLNIQMIQRLKELRELLILLAIIERSTEVSGVSLPDESMISKLNLHLPFEQHLVDGAFRLSKRKRREIFDVFNTDREMALNLVSFTEMMLSLFQETDSTIDGSVLAFFQQREWRLVHNMRIGTTWYSLGDNPEFRDPHRLTRQANIQHLRQCMKQVSGVSREESYYRNCWVLEEVDGIPIRNYISLVIVPAHCQERAESMVRQYGCSAKVIPAEEFGLPAL